MKIKVANYISQFLVDHGVTDAFSVVGLCNCRRGLCKA